MSGNKSRRAGNCCFSVRSLPCTAHRICSLIRGRQVDPSLGVGPQASPQLHEHPAASLASALLARAGKDDGGRTKLQCLGSWPVNKADMRKKWKDPKLHGIRRNGFPPSVLGEGNGGVSPMSSHLASLSFCSLSEKCSQ